MIDCIDRELRDEQIRGEVLEDLALEYDSKRKPDNDTIRMYTVYPYYHRDSYNNEAVN